MCLLKACGNRREAICVSCAERYRHDARRLIGAGLQGGKGVPDSIVAHPAVFVAFTGPSFGPVHTQRHGANGGALGCRPRRDADTCPHGVRMSCGLVHADDDPCLGEPLCAERVDHEAAVLWNNTLGELWRRTTPVYLPRVLARLTGVTQQWLREQVRVAYVKVAEYQRRGLMHLHAVIRLGRRPGDARACRGHGRVARDSFAERWTRDFPGSAATNVHNHERVKPFWEGVRRPTVAVDHAPGGAHVGTRQPDARIGGARDVQRRR